MKQEFITSIGKVIRERDVLFIKNLNFKFHHGLVYELLPPIAWILYALSWFISIENNFELFMGFVVSFIAFFHFYPFYDLIFKRSLSKRIPLQRIESFEVKQGESLLETDVILHLKNGRYRKIVFRTLEKQYEPFTELLSQYTAQFPMPIQS